MLKKLVKYGNSSALVLDKALLELLNIAEGSVVKIKTDGISLIITGQNGAQESITKTITPQETLHEAVEQCLKKCSANEENAGAYIHELKEVFAQYGEARKKLATPEIQRASREIEQRFNGNRLDPEYSKAMLALEQQHVPELAHMEQAVQLISQKYAPQEYQYADKEKKNTLTVAMTEFKKVHEKYRHILEAVTKLHENSDYIHESVLLAEKYQATKNSPEYIKESTQLIAKYVPEYTGYQDELSKVAQSVK